MDIANLVGPWISLLMILVPLIYAERWIHRHLYGIGYLMTQDKGSATGIYYIIFFPGVFLHEFIQYLVSGALDVPLQKIQAYPKVQDNGTMRFDFVSIKPTDRLRASIIGGVPFLVAAFLVYTISTSILDLHSIPEAIGTQDLTTILEAFKGLFNTPNFWFWLYILFAISNGMIPTKEDRQGWRLILAAVLGLTAMLLVIGSHQVVTETLDGPVREGLDLVNTSLAIILGLDICVIFFLRAVEDLFERYRGIKMDYDAESRKKSSQKAIKRPAGSNIPIPKGELMPSIYNLELPIPSLPPKRTAARAIQRAASDVASGRPPSATDAPLVPRTPPAGPARTTTEIPAVETAPVETTAAFRRPTSESRPSETPATPADTQSTAEGARESLRPSFSRPAPSSDAGTPPVSERPLRPRETAEKSQEAPPSRSTFPARPLSTAEPQRERPALLGRRTSDESEPPSDRFSGRQTATPASPSGQSSSATPPRRFGSQSTQDADEGRETSEKPARPTGRISAPSSFLRDRDALAKRTTGESEPASTVERPLSPFSRPSEQEPSRFPPSRRDQPPSEDENEADDDVEYVDFDDA